MNAAAGKRHLARVAALPCALCGESPVEVHHVMADRTPGRRSSDWLTVPLCPDCHRDGFYGIHGRQQRLKMLKTSEMRLLADTLEAIYG